MKCRGADKREDEKRARCQLCNVTMLVHCLQVARPRDLHCSCWSLVKLPVLQQPCGLLRLPLRQCLGNRLWKQRCTVLHGDVREGKEVSPTQPVGESAQIPVDDSPLLEQLCRTR